MLTVITDSFGTIHNPLYFTCFKWSPEELGKKSLHVQINLWLLKYTILKGCEMSEKAKWKMINIPWVVHT